MFYIFNADGFCICSCNYEPDKDDLESRSEVVVQSEENYDISEIKLENGVITDILPSFDELKTAKIAEFKTKRNAEEVLPIGWNGNLYDYDSDSRERMRIKRQDIEDKGGTGKILWTLADNEQTEIGLDDFKGINSVAAERSEALHDKYNSLKAKVEAAASKEELENIVW